MKLLYQQRALRQIDDAMTYIAVRSPDGAAKVAARIMSVLRRVQQFPRSGRRTSINGVRRVYLEPYPFHIDYFVGRDEIVVQRFRHTARRPLPG